MKNQISLVDLCGPGTTKSLNLKSPLDAVEPLGLTSMGCSPLLSHRATATNVILSEINQANGSDQRDLLTTPSDNTSAQWLPYSAYITGLRGAKPIIGTVPSPFPGAGVTYRFDFTVGGFIAFQDANPGVPFQFGDNPVGFGSNTRAYPSIVLGGQSFDATVLGLHSAYHTYDEQLRLPYCPTAPLTPFFNSGTGNITTQDTSLATAFDQQQSSPQASIVCRVWECRPALTMFSGTTVAGSVLSTNANEATLPGHTRTYAYLDFGNVTMPAYGGNLGGVTYPVTPVRPWLVMYCNSGVQNVTLNGTAGTSFAGDTFPLQVQYIGPNQVFNITQAFAWSFDLRTTSFTFQFTVNGQTLSPTTKTIGTAGVPHFFESVSIGQ